MTVPMTTFRDPLSTVSDAPPAPAHVLDDLCAIHLVADRAASLRTGSTHKIYQTWRFEVVCHSDATRAESTRFVVPVVSVPRATGHVRNAMALQPGQGTMAVGDAARFTWTTTTAGTANPFSTAYDKARQWLMAAGWHLDAMSPERIRESAPTAGSGLASWENEGGARSAGGDR